MKFAVWIVIVFQFVIIWIINTNNCDCIVNANDYDCDCITNANNCDCIVNANDYDCITNANDWDRSLYITQCYYDLIVYVYNHTIIEFIFVLASRQRSGHY